MKSKISIIAAIGKNRELGKENKLLWHIPGELKRFKEITSGHPIIMGRKTFESIGRVLPNRINIVITRDTEGFLRKAKKEGQDIRDLIAASSFEDALNVAKHSVSSRAKRGDFEKREIAADSSNPRIDKEDEIFVIGGGQIFSQALPVVDRLYLTLVDKAYDADTFFPDYSAFNEEIEREEGESNGLDYTYITLEK